LEVLVTRIDMPKNSLWRDGDTLDIARQS